MGTHHDFPEQSSPTSQGAGAAKADPGVGGSGLSERARGEAETSSLRSTEVTMMGMTDTHSYLEGVTDDTIPSEVNVVDFEEEGCSCSVPRLFRQCRSMSGRTWAILRLYRSIRNISFLLLIYQAIEWLFWLNCG